MIKQSVCAQFLMDLFNGVHQPKDDYMLALYDQNASIGPQTAQYTPDGEVAGTGYVAGGIVLTGRRVNSTGTGCSLTFDNALFSSVSVSARGALIYNRTRNKAIFVLDFGKVVTATDGMFSVTIPDPLYVLRPATP